MRFREQNMGGAGKMTVRMMCKTEYESDDPQPLLCLRLRVHSVESATTGKRGQVPFPTSIVLEIAGVIQSSQLPRPAGRGALILVT
jgi:hypothetical protein